MALKYFPSMTATRKKRNLRTSSTNSSLAIKTKSRKMKHKLKMAPLAKRGRPKSPKKQT